MTVGLAPMSQRSEFGDDHRGVGAPLISGTRYGVIPGATMHNTTAWAGTTDFWLVSPIVVKRRLLVDGFLTRVLTAQAATTAYFGVYRVNRDTMIPNTLVTGLSGSTSLAGTGTQTISLTAQVLPPGLYALASNTSSTTATLQSMQGSVVDTFGMFGDATYPGMGYWWVAGTAGAAPATLTISNYTTNVYFTYFFALRARPI